MFWKKKEKTTTKMYKRIERLYDMMSELGMGTEYTRDMVKCEYDTYMGVRTIYITKRIYTSNGYCSTLNEHYVVEFQKEIGITPRGCLMISQIFNLVVFKNETKIHKIQPCPISLTAHEIDLAILEFENYINKIYLEHKAKQGELSA